MFKYLHKIKDYFLIKQSGLFDVEYYCLQYPDVRRADVNPLWHFVSVGWKEGRNPSSLFCTNSYLEQNPDVKAALVNPLLHYYRFGKNERRIMQNEIPEEVKERDSAQEPTNSNQFETRYTEEYFEIKNRIITSIESERIRQQKTVIENPDNLLKSFNLIDTNFLDVAHTLDFRDVPQEPTISIIIPVMKKPKYLLECLFSILRETQNCMHSIEILVVQDGDDPILKEIISSVNGILHVQNLDNPGFSHSCNLGASIAKGDYLVFLNDDAQLASSNFFDYLINSFSDEQIGIVGPKILYPNGVLQEAGAVINYDGTTTLIGHGENASLPMYSFNREVDYCSGVCLVIRRRLFDEVSGFDEIYSPAYYEDVDLCLKVKEKGFKCLYNAKSAIYHHLSVTTNSLGDEFKRRQVSKNRSIFLERWIKSIDRLNEVKLIAFYLPQYHIIPENNLFWGNGFTEWTNVAKAKPLFEGHLQPRIPKDLGFYNLDNVEVMEQQAKLAREYGISGFCYYYYWFTGKRVLEKPLERILETNKPDFPFCLCWANENWSARWDGGNNDILLAQDYSAEEDELVILDLIRYFRHPNYIRVNKKPVLMVYREGLFPNFFETAKTWRKVCEENGFDGLHIVLVRSFELTTKVITPQELGADAFVEFPPHGGWFYVEQQNIPLTVDYQGQFIDYEAMAVDFASKPFPNYIEYKTAMPSWDNSPRNKSESGAILLGSTPAKYQAWLEMIIRHSRFQYSGDNRLVFINAWNEWGEGNFLEPDLMLGHQYLQATSNAKQAVRWIGNQ
jgi:GT2 family glycosyltransferase